MREYRLLRLSRGDVGKRQYAANGWPSAAVLTPDAADDSAPDAVVHRPKDAKPK